MKSTLLVLSSLLAATIVGVGGASAADPSEGTVSASSPLITWEGGATAVAQPAPTSGETDGCPPAEADPANTVCDHFLINVDVDPAIYADMAGTLTITIKFTEGEDWDVALYRPGDSPDTPPVNSSASSDNPEVMTVSNPQGMYEFRGAPFTAFDGYDGTAELTFRTLAGVSDPRSPGFQAYSTQAIDPQELGALAAIEDPEAQKDAFGAMLGGRTDRVVSNTEIDYRGKPLLFSNHDIGRAAREPTISVDLDGNLFIPAAGFDSQLNTPAQGFFRTLIMRSGDNGASWQSVSPEVAGVTSPPITGDPYIWTDEVYGRTFSIDLLQLVQNNVMFTDDSGESWTTSVTDATSTVTDHQTLTTGPAPAVLAPLAQGPGFAGRMVYFCFNRIAESLCTRSFDGGLNFSRTGTPPFVGVDPTEADDLFLCGGLHGHIHVAENDGRLMLPKGHCGIPQLAISPDGGTTWDVHVVPGPGAQDTHLSVDTDSEGNIYFTWFDDILKLPFLVTSTDNAATWSAPVMIAPPGVVQVTWPTVYAGDPGRISIGYACNRSTGDAQTSLSRPWDYCITTSTNALDPEPTFLSNIGNPINDPMHRGNCPDRCGNVLDFLDTMAAVPQVGGRTYAAYTDTCTANIFQDGSGNDFPQCNITPTALGFDGELDNASNDDRGFAVIQTCGPSLWDEIGDITDSCNPVQPLATGLVTVLGGPVAVAAAVETGLDNRSIRRTRVEGQTRYDTAANLAARDFPDGADTVYIATGELFPDGLSGGPAAADADAPILLSAKAALPEATRASLVSFSPSKVIIMGGLDAISEAAASQIAQATGVTPTRVAGETRYQTASLISQGIYPNGSNVVLVATGEKFPDALAGAAAAARLKAPVLLTQQGTLPATTRDELARLDADRVVVLGGPVSVSEAVALQIAAAAGVPNVERLAGETRYETAVAISQNVWPSGADTAYLATGQNFPDALAGAAAAATRDAPVLLTPTAELAGVTGDELTRLIARNAVPSNVR